MLHRQQCSSELPKLTGTMLPHFTVSVIHQGVIPVEQKPLQSPSVLFKKKSNCQICHFTVPPTAGTAKIHRVSKKTCQLILFCSVLVKYKPISVKIGRPVLERTLNNIIKLCKKCPLHLKYVLALPWEIWGDRLSCQRSTYMYILMNHWIATNTTSSDVTCSKLHHLYTTC